MTTAPARRVAVVRFSALGDIALCIPPLYDACRANPDVHFTMVTRKAFAAIFVNTPANLTVLGVDLRGAHKGVRGMLRLAGELKDIDTVIDLHDVLRTQILRTRLRLSGKKTVVFDKGRGDKKELVRRGAASFGHSLPSTGKRYRQAFAEAGLSVTESFAGLYADTAADPALFAAVTAPKATGQKWVGVAPFAAHAAKMLPPATTLSVVKALAESDDVTVFLFGGPGREQEVMAQWAAVAPHKIKVVAGSGIGFRGELALMNSLDAMMAMDSGNMHLGGIAGVPAMVSVWGGTHPYAGFTPWVLKPERMVAVSKDMACRPCSVFGNKPCRLCPDSPACMAAITAAELTGALTELLNNQ